MVNVGEEGLVVKLGAWVVDGFVLEVFGFVTVVLVMGPWSASVVVTDAEVKVVDLDDVIEVVEAAATSETFTICQVVFKILVMLVVVTMSIINTIIVVAVVFVVVIVIIINDGVYAEHLKFGPYLLTDLLSQCMSSFFTHGSLPDSMIANVLVPVIKSKLDISCPKTTIDLLRLPAWSAKLLKS